MSDPLLGELMSVSLRDVWPDESASFTPWLARPDNLKRLGDTLGMELETEEEEVAVGPFSADILCKDTADGSWVVIENQIEKTDHGHLGQILTYSSRAGSENNDLGRGEIHRRTPGRARLVERQHGRGYFVFRARN